MINPNYIITGRVDIPNFFFKINGTSYTGDYTVQTAPFKIFGLVANELPFELFFRNTILHNQKEFEALANTVISPLKNELLSKKFQNTKYKIEKIIKFTNSK